MKKRWRILLAAAAVVLAVGALAVLKPIERLGTEFQKEVNTGGEASMHVLDVSRKSVTVQISVNGEIEVLSIFPSLQKEVDGVWYSLRDRHSGHTVNATANWIHNSGSKTTDIISHYGILTGGHYRAVLAYVLPEEAADSWRNDSTRRYIAAEFTL